jgi:hypothetical protein
LPENTRTVTARTTTSTSALVVTRTATTATTSHNQILNLKRTKKRRERTAGLKRVDHKTVFNVNRYSTARSLNSKSVVTDSSRTNAPNT